MDARNVGDGVAIVGYSHRMPGGIRSDADFWRLLSEREVVREPISVRYGKGHVPIGEFSGPGRLASPYEGLIRDEDELLFDRAFFGMSHNELRQTEPQVRMLLNCAWEAIEHVGWDLHSLRNSPTGVFIGSQVPAVSNWRPQHGVTEYSVSGISLAMLANRVSYHFNLMGSSATYCTACSAGVTALHAAMNALRSGDCDQALVGAVTYLGSARMSSSFNLMGIISPDGTCHSFDAGANGYMRSEGSFVFAVKPLAAAERDGDPIYAVIESTAVNAAGTADGSAGLAPGRFISAPTRHAQVELMRAASARAGLSPRDFDYIEAHATGTAVGDRIEGNAIAEAFGDSGRADPLRVSSVKSNVGHMEAAAFHCALLKVVLMMRRRTFAPTSKSFQAPNPEIDFARCPMEVQTECEPFPEHPVVVGINSFGFGGANGHCVVREHRPLRPRLWSLPLAPDAGYMIPLSARTPKALIESAGRLRRLLDDQSVDLYALAGNLSRRRTHFAARTSFVARSVPELSEALDAFVEEEAPIASAEEGERRLAMVFAGQGTQWAGCGRALYDAHPVFRRAVDAIDEHWREHATTSLREACFSAPQDELDEVQLAQPAIFMIQCALVELFKTWGVYPDCVVGHSSGEVAAAYACGALSLADATRLVFHRATLQQRVAGSGRMLSIGLDRPGVEELLDEMRIPFRLEEGGPVAVEIACENAPANTVICGREGDLQPVMEALDRRSLQNRLIPGNIAFHSRAMDAIRDGASDALAFLADRAFELDVPFVSSVTGAAAERLDSAYWWSNIRQPVRFAAAMETVIREHRPDVVLEVAPHSALQPIVAQCVEGAASPPVSIPTLMRETDTRLAFHAALGALFRAGVPLDFAAQYPRPDPIVPLLPGHPRDEQKTVDRTLDDEFFLYQSEYAHGPLVGHRIPGDRLSFEARLSERAFPWLAEHRVHHAPIMPAAGFIELVLQALEGAPVHIEMLEFLQPCPIPRTPVPLQTALQPVPNSPDEFTLTVTTQPYDIDAKSELHGCGHVRRIGPDNVPDVPANVSEIDASRYQPLAYGADDELYERFEAVLGETFQYGPNFRNMRRLRRDVATDHLLFDVEMDEALWRGGQREGYVLFPALLDGGLQSYLYDLMLGADLFAIPRRAENVTFLRPPTVPRMTCRVTYPGGIRYEVDDKGQYSVQTGEWVSGSLSCYDGATGDLVLHIEKYISFISNPRRVDLPHSKHRIAWQPKFVADGRAIAERLPEGEIEPAALIAALERPEDEGGDVRACHALEFAGALEPERTVLHRCVDHLSRQEAQSEFWLIGDDEEGARAHFDAFHGHDAALRFDCLDPTAREPAALEGGLLRRHAAEVLFLHSDAQAFTAEEWSFWQAVAVPGALALVSHDEGRAIAPAAGWRTLRAGRGSTLLQAPSWSAAEPGDAALPGPRWVLGEPQSWAAAWASLLDDPSVHPLAWESLASDERLDPEACPHAEDVQAIDVFFDRDPEDPTGERAVSHLVALIQSLVPYRIDQASGRCRLTVVTRQAILDADDARGSALWGAVRSMAAEVADEAKLDFRLVDLGDAGDLKTLAWLARHDLRERELAVRAGRLWVPRVLSNRQEFPPVPAGEHPPYRLFLENAGQIAGLQMKTYEPPPLGPHHVEIEVAAAALNFRDVMVTLGLLPALAYERSALGREVGMEASGVVRRAGTAVEGLEPGDEVVFVDGGCIANRTVVGQHRVFPKPAGLSMEEAASSLSVYVTSYYALVHLARLRKGQRVLIHSAMGGIGQAAIALANDVGAEVYATAGSESKRARLLELGVRAAFDSHSEDWYAELMQATGGQGVDVVLNSLAGRHVSLCLEALRPGGWHCEIGKVDIYADSALGLRVFRKNLRFAAIDLDRLMVDDPLLSRELSQACLDLLDRGVVPPLPVTVFPYGDYAKALRLMTTGQHQGKLVLQAPPASADPGFPIDDRRPLLDPDATYLVTGGLGGFGQRLLPYLVSAGARHLTLMDRDPARRRSESWLRRSTTLTDIGKGLEIDLVQGDVAVEADVRRCVANTKKPLKGVFHLAGTLDDCLLADLSAESLARVFAPKARGALNLHRATAGLALDHFVMVSSTSSTFGNPGQINYSAANAYLDGLAACRHRQGLPALSYNLAAVADAGMAARNLGVLRLMKAAGMPPVSSYFAVANLDHALRTMGGSDHLITALFKRLLWSVESSDYMRTGRLMSNQDAFSVGSDERLTVEAVMAQIAAKVAELCGHDEGGLEEPLSSFGLNSISVAELGAFIQSEFGFQASALELMTTASCQSLAHAIVHGTETDDEADADDEDGEAGDAPLVAARRVRRNPSVFASQPEDHFPPAPCSGRRAPGALAAE
ncbi:MAG: SDR family NAD(P)-dependent oxidoreductase [Rhodospirillales bacterium]|nr:SDR family NAD(P)-dependent oxidoreductase [Rhodospirillales bacterium]MDE0378016.1 SDR family NAD(P)-dependent oxidoreductase [Rhodospirillales bacterium]